VNTNNPTGAAREMDGIGIASDPRVAHVVAAASAAAGVGDWFQVIPDDIGKLAALCGAVLSAVLIFTHARRGRLDSRKLQLEIRALEAKEAARAAHPSE
jgi:hypothetical protein